MKRHEGRFEGAGGVSLYRRSWAPEAPPRAVVVLAHGMSEHSGRYDHVGRFLAERGVEVHALDHRGHGRSGGETGTVERFELFLDDLSTFLSLVRDEQPEPGVATAAAGTPPLVLIGHSMGGLIVAAYLLERRPQPDLVVLSGPAIVPILEPDAPRIDATRLSRDPEVQRAYLEDPLVLRERVQDGLFVALAHGLALLPGRSGEVTQPIYLLHGTSDRLCSAEGAEAWVRGCANSDVTVKLYPEGRHEMMNEENRDEVLADLWAWLDPRIPARSPA